MAILPKRGDRLAIRRGQVGHGEHPLAVEAEAGAVVAELQTPAQRNILPDIEPDSAAYLKIRLEVGSNHIAKIDAGFLIPHRRRIGDIIGNRAELDRLSLDAGDGVVEGSVQTRHGSSLYASTLGLPQYPTFFRRGDRRARFFAKRKPIASLGGGAEPMP